MTQDHIDYILELLTIFFLKVVSTVDVYDINMIMAAVGRLVKNFELFAPDNKAIVSCLDVFYLYLTKKQNI